MRVLAIADHESKVLWDYYATNQLNDIDMILSCGDLDADYLTFLATLSGKPLYYVHGNHDDKYDRHAPEGCICIDDKLVVYQGIRVLGLGGCNKYRDGTYMYTEQEMKARIRRLRRQIRKHGGFDILLTHAAVRGFGDMDTDSHRGFEAFKELIETYHPKVVFHGHVHLNYGANLTREYVCGDTKIVNAYETYRMNLE